MYQVRLLSIAPVLLAFCGCSGQPDEDSSSPVARPSAAQLADTHDDHADLRHERLGPIEYDYDPDRFTQAEIELPIPPGKIDTAFAIKIIPKEDFDNLGTVGCSYGVSVDDVECTAEEEVGLAISLLERPIDDYRQSFAEEDGVLEATTIDGQEGFAYSAMEAGSEIEYRFVPLGERTVLTAYRFDPDVSEPERSMTHILASIDLDF